MAYTNELFNKLMAYTNELFSYFYQIEQKKVIMCDALRKHCGVHLESIE
jgi:hypothetical protein